MTKELILRPRLSEQTYTQSKSGVYVFDVPTNVNKHTVARAVAAQYNVTVDEVNTTTIKGKPKRTLSITGRRRGATDGVRSDIKKAYVKLTEGMMIPVFAAVEEAQQKENTAQEQIDKAMTKQSAANGKKTSGGNRVARLFKKQEDK